MNTATIDINPIIEYLEEGIACAGAEHPGWNALAEAVRNAVNDHIEEFGTFDIDNEEDFDRVINRAYTTITN